MRSLLVAVLCILAAGQDLCAQAWQTAAPRLHPGVRIRIEKTDSTKTKGTVAAVGSDTLSIERKGGAETITVAGIRKIWIRRGRLRSYAPLMGAAAGAGTLGAIASRPSMDFTGKGVALFAGIGAGAGALIGWVIRADAKDELVYDSATN
ncbi:MAG: hypothetical protein ACM336_06960 [Acidobacteriota bacterium]